MPNAVQMIDLKLIEADPNNARKDFPKEALASLAHSIIERGVQQPIKLRPLAGGKFRVVFGERRFRASGIAGLEKIPAFVENLTDLQAADLQLAENIDREQLAPLEVAGGYQRQLDLGVPMDKLCEKSGRKRSTIYATIALLKLSPDAKKALGEERISASVGQLVAKYVPVTSQAAEIGQVEGMSYRDAERYLLQKHGQLDLKKAPFDLKDAKLCAKAGACTTCPKRSGNSPDAYPEMKGPDTCTDRPCYFLKLFDHHKKAFEVQGLKLLSPAEVPTIDLFWEHSNALRPDSGYVEPNDRCHDDAKQRPYVDLLEPEQVKKLTVVALNHAGQPFQLLQRKPLAKELKKAGKVMSFAQLDKERTKKQKAKAEKEGKPVEKGPDLEELARDVLVGKCVAAIEDKGMLTSPMLNLVSRALFDKMNYEGRIAERRKIGNTLGLAEARRHETAFPKLTPGKLAGLIFEQAFDDIFEVGTVLELDTLAADVCELLHVDPEKVHAEVKAGIEAKKAAAAAKPAAKPVGNKPAKKAAKAGKKAA